MSNFRDSVPQKDKDSQAFAEKQRLLNAMAFEKKVEFDNEKLLILLRNARQELQGLRLIHLHLSLLRSREANAQSVVRTVVTELQTKASFLQIFAISNGDIIVLYKGIKLTSITEVCQKLEQLFLARSTLTGQNHYKDNSLYSILELSLNFINVIRFIEELGCPSGDLVGEDTKPPITLEAMAKLERSVCTADLSPFLLNQPVVNISSNQDDQFDYYEMYISIKMLQDRLSPNHDIAANKWLFNYFTSNLDHSVLRSLAQDWSVVRGRRIGININLATVISTGFVKFDEKLPSDCRGRIMLEINKSDLIENLALFDEVRDFAKERKYGIVIDGLNPYLVANLDLEYLGADYGKMFWSPDMPEMEGNFKKSFMKRIAEQDHCRFILARCDSVASLLFAYQSGIKFVQGRGVDHILRKGIRVFEAIETASGKHSADGRNGGNGSRK